LGELVCPSLDTGIWREAALAGLPTSFFLASNSANSRICEQKTDHSAKVQLTLFGNNFFLEVPCGRLFNINLIK
jgi:hypothetical protein